MGAGDIVSLAEQRVGQSLRGKYTLERLLGVGAMAAVYVARHRNGGSFAVKVLHTSIALQADLKMRFLREGYIANRIDHPNIVRILDDDVDDATGSAFIVMELLDGMTLESEWLNAGRQLPVGRVLFLASLLLEVLEAAHGAGVIHRDVKPDNLFVMRTGGLKVLDFGIARLMDASRQATGSGQMLGTPEFASPEQAGGRVDEVGPRSDLYSVGAMMFTLLTGQNVHPARSPTESMVFAATRPARLILDVAAHLDPRLANVVDVALSFQREQRWQNAPQMRRALGTVPVAPITTVTPTAMGPERVSRAMPVSSTLRVPAGDVEEAIPLVPKK